ncbi:MAG TPA: hypothetical protein VHG93_22925 [Longimicrobium sp.]|nr:hypothetical protein [Longimicrobium sp.]
MIQATVNRFLEATLDLTVHGPDGQEEILEFKIDTGFDGALTLHSAVVAALGLERLKAGRVILADGSETSFPICHASVEWGGVRREVDVYVTDSILLLGMAMLAGHEVRMEVVPDGTATITPLGPLMQG